MRFGHLVGVAFSNHHLENKKTSKTMAEAVVGQLVMTLGAALAKEAATYGLWWSTVVQGSCGLEGSLRQDPSVQGGAGEHASVPAGGRAVQGHRRGHIHLCRRDKLEDSKHGGFAGKMKKRMKHIKTWPRLAAKLQEIEAQLQDANRRKRDYAVSGLS